MTTGVTSLGHHQRPATRADFGLVGLDNQIERSWIDIAFGQQNGFECAHPNGRLRQFRTMIMIVVVVMVGMPVMMIMGMVVIVVVIMRAHGPIMARSERACKQSRYVEIH